MFFLKQFSDFSHNPFLEQNDDLKNLIAQYCKMIHDHIHSLHNSTYLKSQIFKTNKYFKEAFLEKIQKTQIYAESEQITAYSQEQHDRFLRTRKQVLDAFKEKNNPLSIICDAVFIIQALGSKNFCSKKISDFEQGEHFTCFSNTYQNVTSKLFNILKNNQQAQYHHYNSSTLDLSSAGEGVLKSYNSHLPVNIQFLHNSGMLTLLRTRDGKVYYHLTPAQLDTDQWNKNLDIFKDIFPAKNFNHANQTLGFISQLYAHAFFQYPYVYGRNSLTKLLLEPLIRLFCEISFKDFSPKGFLNQEIEHYLHEELLFQLISYKCSMSNSDSPLSHSAKKFSDSLCESNFLDGTLRYCLNPLEEQGAGFLRKRFCS